MDDAKARTYMIATTLTALALFLIPATLVAVVDPYFYFHKPFYMKTPTFSGTARYQNAGLINSWLADPAENIDTILIGTSMSENFPVAAMKNADGVPLLKLTVAGALPREQVATFEHAARTGRVRHVVWEIMGSYNTPKADEINPNVDFPFFLYSSNPLESWRYIFNNDVVERAMGLVKARKKGRVPLEDLYTWKDEESFAAFASPENIKKLKTDLKTKNTPLKSRPAVTDRFPNVDLNLMPQLRNHPEIAFQLYFPPVSYYQYAEMGNDQFAQLMDMRQRVLEATKDMKNVRVYGFDLIDGIGDTLTNYRDTAHYRPSTNALIAESLVHDRYRLTVENWPGYKTRLMKRVNAWGREFLKSPSPPGRGSGRGK